MKVFSDACYLRRVAMIGTKHDGVVKMGRFLDVSKGGTFGGQRLFLIGEHSDRRRYEFSKVPKEFAGKILSFVNDHVNWFRLDATMIQRREYRVPIVNKRCCVWRYGFHLCVVASAYELVHGMRSDLILRQLSDEVTKHPVVGDENHREFGTGQHLGTVNREYCLAGTRWSHYEQRLSKRRLIDFELLLITRDLLVGR